MLPFLNGSTFGFSLENKWCHLLMYHTWAGHLCEIKKAKLIVKDKQKTQPGKCEKHAFIFFVAFLRCSQTLAQLPLAQVCVHTYIWMGFSIFILIILIFFFFYSHMAWFCSTDLVQELLFEIKMFVSIFSLIVSLWYNLLQLNDKTDATMKIKSDGYLSLAIKAANNLEN